MHKQNISCCYYPTTAVFIDDSKSFLDNILLELDSNINAISFAEPAKAIEYLRSNFLPSFTNKYLRSLKNNEQFIEHEYSNVEHGYVDVDIFSIHKEIYNPCRFNAATVVVVDYAMPSMNGLELCKSLQGLPFKFVLVTGDVTLDKTIDAFNAGLIQQFILKSSNDFVGKLQNIIHTLQEKQFEEFSDTIIKNLSANRRAGLSDPLVVAFLKNFFKRNNVAEYYLINESGCFLMSDLYGDLSIIVVKDEEEMTEHTNTAIDNYGSEDIINMLRSREKLLFLCRECDHINITVNNWSSYLYPATKLIGENGNYYYAHIKKLIGNNMLSNQIVSYDNFLAETASSKR